jgi:hypothetical protein
MSRQMVDTLFHGDTAIHPERFLGLAPRYPTVDPAKSQTATNVIDMGGHRLGQHSVWIVVWGPRAARQACGAATWAPSPPPLVPECPRR